MSEELKHYGMPRRSGRYPWGSGDTPYQRNKSFLGMVDNLQGQGLSEIEIAKGFGITTSQLRARKSLSTAAVRGAESAEALRLKNKGYSNVEIGRRMGKNESSIRNLLNPVLQERAKITEATSNMLKESVAQKGYIDVGAGVENHVGVSRTKLNTAISELEEQGYKLHYVKVEQLGVPGHYTSIKVLAGPDSTYSDVFKNKDKIQTITSASNDFGRSFNNDLGLKPVQSIKSDRISVRYAEDGGGDKDGVIEMRRGVKDLNLGGSQYAQVRIGVDGTHFLKGMAIYSDNLPDGVDIVFNTNKHYTGNKLDAMKKMKDDPDNPFGSTIKFDGQKGALNVVNEEGDWGRWSRSIASQMLSKQTPALAKTQLDLALGLKQNEFDETNSLTNPVVKKKLLTAFADDCDSSAVHLKAAGLPRQAWKLILPVPELKPNEVYAPTFKDGEPVVLIRYPHGGTFEIPQVTVNNKSLAAQKIMKNAPDAIGINPVVAKKLSGADFDGDTVLVIPNKSGVIKTSSSLKGLQNFDPIEAYPAYEGMKRMTAHTKGVKMGEVSNLITDMTIKGASTDEIARAVRHSMVVIDAEKHNLNYKQSYIDNGIASLSEKYQRSSRGGASTLISQASSEIRVPERTPSKDKDPLTGKNLYSRVGQYAINPRTGEKVYSPTGASYVNKQGRTIEKTTTSTKMAEVSDAFRLSSGTPMEAVYAAYANNLKALANTSRRIVASTKNPTYSPSAKVTYAEEVATLNAKLNVALKNAPIERQAQILANAIVDRKKEANPNMEYAELKKVRNQALAETRIRMGAKKQMIDVTPKEWNAIQAGAISANKLSQILDNTDLDKVKQYATPRTTLLMPPAKISRARSMLASGYTQSEIAEALGVSVSTLSNALA